MAIDTTRKGQQVRNVLTGETAVIEHHWDGYGGNQDIYLVTLDRPYPNGTTQAWWKPEHIASRGRIGEIASYGDQRDLGYDIEDTVNLLGDMVRVGRSFEAIADDLELMTAAMEMEFQGGAEEACEGVLRAVVRMRLTPDRWVEIPGLGISVPVYS